MKKQSTIDEWSFLYWFLKIVLVRHVHNFFYRKIEIVHAERIPDGKPVILAPNHQNALMDPMAFVAGIKYQTVFLARADVFKGGFIIKLLTFLKILPIYRIRDGISNLQKNDEIFDATLDILRNKKSPLCIFPEGNHGNRRRLRPLVKGIFRIAFRAQEDYKSEPGVKIVPVGIDYSHYWKFRQTQLIIFGQPVEVSEYWNAYKENPTIAINMLRERLAREMKNYMIHIESEEFYDLYMGMRVICRESMINRLGYKKINLYTRFLADKKLIELLDECLSKQPGKMDQLNKVFLHYRELRNSLKFRDWIPVKKSYNIFLNILALVLSAIVWPLVVLGIFNNWPHFIIPVRFQKGIKDTQFFSTAKWGSGFAIMVLYYLILFVLAMIFLPVWWIKILYLITLPSSGLFALDYRRFVIKSWARIRYSFSVHKKNSATARFKSTYDQMFSLVNEIVENK